MAEYLRRTDYVGGLWQWTDTDLCIVLDRVTGEPQRFGTYARSIGLLEDALQHVNEQKGWEWRLVIVRLNAIAAHPVVALREAEGREEA